ncbi:MAG: tRNA pseudouridine(55) synthase TruB [Chitinophagales bacterium]|nr:tRNA pseudouridine(55) synthase TruB [Chitinophagales bacterium]
MTDFSEGKVILIDKPLDWTSFDIVNKIKYSLKKKFPKLKVGHAGTLDPKATGLLIVCTGKFTKKITEIQDQYKIYTGSFFLGATTECYDTERPVNQTFETSHISEQDIYDNVQYFLGKIEQIPPAHSAIKIQGKNAYELARKGETVNIQPREVFIYNFDITKIEFPYIYFKIKCSKGTYIRSIAHEFGKKMNNGAYLASLRRENIGEYSVENAFQIQDFIQHVQTENIES